MDELSKNKQKIRNLLDTGKSQFLKIEHLQNLTDFFSSDEYYQEKHKIIATTFFETISELLKMLNLANLSPIDKKSLIQLIVNELLKSTTNGRINTKRSK